MQNNSDHIGITGSSTRVTERQANALLHLLTHLRAQGFSHFHFGDCVQADEIGARIALRLGYYLHSHPPTNPVKRAGHFAHSLHPAKDYLIRNRDIVDASALIIGVPDTDYEKLRSGTWSTLRYARKTEKPRIILLP